MAWGYCHHHWVRGTDLPCPECEPVTDEDTPAGPPPNWARTHSKALYRIIVVLVWVALMGNLLYHHNSADTTFLTVLAVVTGVAVVIGLS